MDTVAALALLAGSNPPPPREDNGGSPVPTWTDVGKLRPREVS